jgi:hypothetical protein
MSDTNQIRQTFLHPIAKLYEAEVAGHEVKAQATFENTIQETVRQIGARLVEEDLD